MDIKTLKILHQPIVGSSTYFVKSWFYNGVEHRTDGPAYHIVSSNGDIRYDYVLDGISYSEEVFKFLTSKRDKEA